MRYLVTCTNIRLLKNIYFWVEIGKDYSDSPSLFGEINRRKKKKIN